MYNNTIVCFFLQSENTAASRFGVPAAGPGPQSHAALAGNGPAPTARTPANGGRTSQLSGTAGQRADVGGRAAEQLGDDQPWHSSQSAGVRTRTVSATATADPSDAASVRTGYQQSLAVQ